jgi:hypothetical protein
LYVIVNDEKRRLKVENKNNCSQSSILLQVRGPFAPFMAMAGQDPMTGDFG